MSPQNANILIVDDTHANLSVLTEILSEQGYLVRPVPDGYRALLSVQAELPELILLDIVMPEMSGYEVCQQLKKDERTRDIPVIFISALNDVFDKVKAFEIGGVDYITKPFQVEEVIARVKTHLTLRNFQQQLQEQNILLEQLYTIAKSINSEIDLVNLLESLLQEIQFVTGAERAAALIYEASLDAYLVKASVGVVFNQLKSIQMSLTEVEEQYLKDAKQPYRDIFLIDHIRERPAEKMLKDFELPKVMLIMRLQRGNNVEGYLFLENMNAEHVFEDQAIQILNKLKDHIISAFIKSKLLSELQTANLRLKEANQKLEEASLTDPLTGMKNRRYLSKVINSDIAKVRRDYDDAFRRKTECELVNADLVFLMVDLDHFKVVNDLYGHEAGDQVLIQIRGILEEICRETDIVIRWGGEEFLIVSRYSNHVHAQNIAERMRKKIEEYPFNIGSEQLIHLKCSIGLASYPFLPSHPGCLTWDQVVTIADQGLYAAKMSGRNAWVAIMSTEKTRPENLFQRIHADIKSLIKAEEVQVFTSIPDLRTLLFK